MKITGKILKGSYLSALRDEIGKLYDVPTGITATVEIDGKDHQSTVYERREFRGSEPSKLICRFVKLGGFNYEIDEI